MDASRIAAARLADTGLGFQVGGWGGWGGGGGCPPRELYKAACWSHPAFFRGCSQG